MCIKASSESTGTWKRVRVERMRINFIRDATHKKLIQQNEGRKNGTDLNLLSHCCTSATNHFHFLLCGIRLLLLFSTILFSYLFFLLLPCSHSSICYLFSDLVFLLSFSFGSAVIADAVAVALPAFRFHV